jgi:hypothetical protein
MTGSHSCGSSVGGRLAKVVVMAERRRLMFSGAKGGV